MNEIPDSCTVQEIKYLWKADVESLHALQNSYNKASERISTLEEENQRLKEEVRCDRKLQIVDAAVINKQTGEINDLKQKLAEAQDENRRLKDLISEADNPDGSLIWNSDHKKILAHQIREAMEAIQKEKK